MPVVEISSKFTTFYQIAFSFSAALMLVVGYRMAEISPLLTAAFLFGSMILAVLAALVRTVAVDGNALIIKSPWRTERVDRADLKAISKILGQRPRTYWIRFVNQNRTRRIVLIPDRKVPDHVIETLPSTDAL